MQERGFYHKPGFSPAGVTIIVAAHAAAIAALALAKMDVPIGHVFTPLETYPVPPEQTDPVPPPPEPKVEPRQQSQIDVPAPLVAHPTTSFILSQPKQDPVPFDVRPVGETRVEPKSEPVIALPPAPDPVRVEAKLRAGELQPPYPASEQRLQREGRVVLRLVIGADGRVMAVEKVSATSDAFFDAARRHAVKAWRFAPATEDGLAVESSRTMTIAFRLDD